jgi:heme oxygenase
MSPPEPDIPSARAALRAATAAAHERLHHLAAFAPLAAGTISRDAYRTLMARTYGFHVAMEAAIAAATDGTAFAAIAARCRRAVLLRDDLIALGLTSVDIERIELADRLPDMSTAPRALGCLYVLEGSTLGGRQLARGLDHFLPRDTRAGRAFLSAGADPGHVGWRAFCDVIDRGGAATADRADMIGGALATFARFESWFNSSENASSARM